MTFPNPPPPSTLSPALYHYKTATTTQISLYGNSLYSNQFFPTSHLCTNQLPTSGNHSVTITISNQFHSQRDTINSVSTKSQTKNKKANRTGRHSFKPNSL